MRRYALSTLPILAALALASCSDSTGPDDGGGNGVCKVTVSGASVASANGTFNCNASPIAAWGAQSNMATVGFQVVTPTATVALTWPGDVTTGDHKNNDAGVTGSIFIQSGQATWAAISGSGSALQGSYTLHLTSATLVAGSTATAKAYTIRGTLDATLPAVSGSGATGTITVHATF